MIVNLQFNKSKIAIIDYGVGNVQSVKNAFNAIVNSDVYITKDPKIIIDSDFLILPGVGAFDTAMNSLKSTGLIPTLENEVLNKQKPLLGICLGFQILFTNSEEGSENGLNWIPGKIIHFDRSYQISIPHFGWNEILIKDNEWLFSNMSKNKNFYFAHSYHVSTNDKYVSATCIHGYEFPVIVRKKNIFGFQFHPEKSHKSGLNLLKNFLLNNKNKS